MTLRRRLWRQIAAVVAGVLLLGGAAVVGILGLREDYGVALRADVQLREVYRIGTHVAVAKAQLDQSLSGRESAGEELGRAVELCLLMELPDARGSWIGQTREEGLALAAAIRTARQRLEAGDESGVGEVYRHLAEVSTATQGVIAQRQVLSDRWHRVTLWVVGVVALVTCVGVAWAGWGVYRAVMRPLDGFRRSVRRIAAGDFGGDVRKDVGGDAEFVALAADVGVMSEELRATQEELERRIELKSRELVRSERLASVGYLAAGVAHEINNPLGIITGYGERAVRRIDRDGADGLGMAREALGVICEEAFRCKRITERLLELARPGEARRQEVSLGALAREVASLVTGAGRFSGRSVAVAGDAAVWCDGGEMRQVLINLLINALEATAGVAGPVVDVRVSRVGELAEIQVADNGLGMTGEVAGRVFEPFYTEKRGEERPAGTGLGLSLAHAIVAAHGGTIEATSAGVGRGATFTVRLPVGAEVVR